MKKTIRIRGFSLVEMAVVLLIIGLLIGGVLRGQELVVSARVRNVADQIKAVQVAFYGFQDRYSALPGDLTAVQAAAVNANTNVAQNTPGDGWIPIQDSQQFFNNIAQAGFISCTPCMSAAASTIAAAASSPTNVYGQPLAFIFPVPGTMPDNNLKGTYYLSTQAKEGTKALASTGGQISSAYLAEIDRKIDDGYPATGQFRFSGSVPSVSGILAEPELNTCLTPDAANVVVLTSTTTWKAKPAGQCQGVLLL